MILDAGGSEAALLHPLAVIYYTDQGTARDEYGRMQLAEPDSGEAQLEPKRPLRVRIHDSIEILGGTVQRK